MQLCAIAVYLVKQQSYPKTFTWQNTKVGAAVIVHRVVDICVATHGSM